MEWGVLIPAGNKSITNDRKGKGLAAAVLQVKPVRKANHTKPIPSTASMSAQNLTGEGEYESVTGKTLFHSLTLPSEP